MTGHNRGAHHRGPRSGETRSGETRSVRTGTGFIARQAPFLIGLSGFALGIFLGGLFRLTPDRTEYLGEQAEKLKDQASKLKDGVSELAVQGYAQAKETIGSVTEKLTGEAKDDGIAGLNDNKSLAQPRL